MVTNHNLSKVTRQRNNSQFNAFTKKASNNGDTEQQEKVSRPPRESSFISGDSMIKKRMVIYLPVLLIINTL